MDLTIAPGPGVRDGLVIAQDELVERFSRSSGPGGQGVNTADSRVELEFDVLASPSLTPIQRERIIAALGGRLVSGRLIIAASEFRSQRRNRVAARERMAVLLRAAMAPPAPPRRRTKPTRAAQQRRLDAKQRRGRIKANRSRPQAE
ncbi:MAG: alternative ribosome rescue aminoacyl-tRNA hydrolase ArfB [Tetrasphaera sp.]